ncbi:hypothetical protein RO07_21015 [Pandoraea pulmonicola]|uniref:Uncharacterized protein n=1 Tax=Pandoraea pulmonicola TaxID=93221 RepID=A0ABN4F2Q5_PANPU|nr:hypothetical protein RO07_21015 [Pandoraea pulmonicola]
MSVEPKFATAALKPFSRVAPLATLTLFNVNVPFVATVAPAHVPVMLPPATVATGYGAVVLIRPDTARPLSNWFVMFELLIVPVD